ncbi:HAD family hydrolase [Phaeovulum sp. NW3]|uniref:HAD family hydrolase n=1 Tax=Phaeovulum sp. NW3 TaxID=2934933 RepID=UPI002021BADA|nr:HAD family hydrolase [Phaeovulum sp. NW3]
MTGPGTKAVGHHISAILFDKDGTLFDFHASWGVWARDELLALSAGDDGLAETLAAAIGYSFAPPGPDGRRAAGRFAPQSPVIAGTVEEVADLLLPHLRGQDRPALINQMNARAARAPLAPAVPLRPLLADLRGRGLRIGLATNDAEAPARAHLTHAGVLDLFDFVAGYDSGHGAKPAPGQLLAFAAAVGVAPASVVMVGDSRHDLRAGRAAGMRALAVLSGPASAEDLAPEADAVLPDIGAIPAWLDALHRA